MPTTAFLSELARYGPERAVAEPLSLRAARRYCRRLAREHYENFTVASWLLPRDLRQHFCHVYAYCRWADDLADETGDPARSLELLDWWEAQLRDCYRGRAEHPVFIALAETIERFTIPPSPFLNLLVAFRQDQYKMRYDSHEELLEYCRNSANPVGHLVLYLGECYDPERAALADSICTGLQLANFWQDVARDWDAGRVYLPQDVCREVGYDESCFQRRQANGAFRRMLAGEVRRAEAMLKAGWPLIKQVPRKLGVDVELFIRGGLATLGAIRKIDYDVWSRRPTVSRAAKFRMLVGCWWRGRFGRRHGGGR